MMPILAQATDLTSVPAEVLKWVLIILIALFFVAAAVVGLVVSLRKKEPVKLDDNPPLSVSKVPKRYNYDLAEQRHTDHERRLADLENWRTGLLAKLDEDKAEIIRTGEERASRIHSHIESDRREMDRKIEALPNNIIATLKNTGAI